MNYKILNFGINGYGTLQSYLLLKDPKPKIVDLAYGTIPDERNTFTRSRLKIAFFHNKLGELNQPYAFLSKNNGLKIKYSKVLYNEFFLMRYSALIHFIEKKYNDFEFQNSKSNEVSKLIIKKIIDLIYVKKIMLNLFYLEFGRMKLHKIH
jgi:hypothetical protein